MSRRLIDITEQELFEGIKKLLPDSTEAFAGKPPVTIVYAAKWLGFKGAKSIYDRIDKKQIRTVKDGGKMKIPFSELIRLDKK